MSISSDSIKELLTIPKLIVVNSIPQEDFVFRFGTGLIDKRYDLCSINCKWRFSMKIFQKKHQKDKPSFHFQETEQLIQLLRVDYAGGHQNPFEVIGDIPDALLPYVGRRIEESHIHINVQGEKNLVWAIPLTECGFPVKRISNFDDFCDAVKAFCQEINLQTRYTIEGRLFL